MGKQGYIYIYLSKKLECESSSLNPLSFLIRWNIEMIIQWLLSGDNFWHIDSCTYCGLNLLLKICRDVDNYRE